MHWITARNLSDLSCLQQNVWRYLHKCEEGFDQHSSLKTFNELQKKKRLNECFQDLLMVSINFMNDNLQVFFKSINSMAVGKASTSRKCRILLGLRSRILILKALSSSCHILLVFMKVVFIHFPWLRWARSERPAPTNEEFLPAHQPLPITKFCSTVESRIPTANEGFADISRCLTPNE